MIEIDDQEKTVRAVLYLSSIVLLTLSTVFIISGFLVGLNPLSIFKFFFSTSVGSFDGFLRTLVRTTPLLISTLGLIVAFKCGIWNVGGEGQIVIGIIVTAGIGLFLDLPPIMTIPLAFLGSFLASGAYGTFPGFLKSRWDINEIPITMMQTFVAFALLQYLINGPWNWGVGLYPRTKAIPLEKRLPFIKYPLNVTFLIGLFLVFGIYLLLNRTVLGYEMHATGSNRIAAFNYGINTGRITTLSMLISGGICGLTGTSLVLGEFFRAQAGMSGNYGFYAIAAALIADNRIILAPFSALLIALIYEGILGLTALGLPHQLGEVVIGVVFIAVLWPRAVKWFKGE